MDARRNFSDWFFPLAGDPLPHNARNLRHRRPMLSLASGDEARSVSGATSLHARPGGSLGLGGDFRPTRLVTTAYPVFRAAVDPVGTAGACADSPAGCPSPVISFSPIVEAPMSVRKSKRLNVRSLQQALQATPTPPIVNPAQATTAARPADAAADLRRVGRITEQVRHEAEACAKLAALPVQHSHAAGIDVGDSTHWVCVESTPDGADTVCEFPAHTPGLRQLVAWLRQCGVTTVAAAE